MKTSSPHTILHSFLYGGACVLLAIDLYFLVIALFVGEFAPVVPLLAGMCITAGLLAIIYAEGKTRGDDRREHRKLSRVASQLEQPIQSLEDDIEYLVRQSDALPAEIRLKLKRMNTKTRVVLENVRDIFLMLRAQGGKVAQEMKVYNACALVEEAISKVEKLASARNVEIIRKMHCEDAPVRLDRNLFSIALTHILENGMLYTLKPGLVNIVIIRGKKFVRIIVQDRGIGLKEEDAHAIFDPFVRGQYASQYDQDGIGVGLTLSRLLIQECNGRLTWRQRSESSGLEFEIKLPLYTA
ncbi:MAG TPA: HAMP domain-containing sensor histidine kinase [Candidatus Andersenbacteria bacterium]|nr:HAMP domain-containing sensor histidine kinase [Candidatus Andersenbacteria bacterium]